MKFEYIAKNPTESEVSRRVPGAGLEQALFVELCGTMRLVLSSPSGMRRYQALQS